MKGDINLNTSYVKVQCLTFTYTVIFLFHLNTSYVKVQLNVEFEVIEDNDEFKYILC